MSWLKMKQKGETVKEKEKDDSNDKDTNANQLIQKQKRAIKAIVMFGKIKLKRIYKIEALNKKQREVLEKEVLSLTDILNIRLDNNELLNHENIKEITDDKLKEIFETRLKELEKLV